jgi:hypothetical protein
MKNNTPDSITLIDTFANKINITDPAPYVTCIVSNENKQISIIGGSSDSLNVIHIPITDHPQPLKDGKWSINSDFFKVFVKNTHTPNTIGFLFDYDDDPKYPMLAATKLAYGEQGRYCQSVEAYQPHIEYYLHLSQKQFLDIMPQHCHEIIHLRYKHKSFTGIYINKEQQTIQVVDGDNIINYKYPEDLLDFPTTVYLTAETVKTLDSMNCSSLNTLSLCVEQDQVLLSSPAGHFSSSNKMPDQINANIAATQDNEVIFIAENGFLIHNELKNLNSKLNEIKNTNTGFFYFFDSYLYILARGSTIKTIAKIKAKASSKFNSDQLYRFTLTHLKELFSTSLSKTNYNKINNPKITMTIYKTADNTRKLHISDSRVKTVNTIPIEKDNIPESIKNVKKTIQLDEKFKEKAKLAKSTQLDLFSGDA